jgi:hypothetical protein
MKTIGNRLTYGQIDENGSYLGAPLIIAFLGSWFYYYRDRTLRVTGFVALACWIISLGPWLSVDNRYTSIPLPFNLLARLPGIVDLLPVRFSLYVMFFVSATVALALAQVVRAHLDGEGRHRRSLRHRILVSSTAVLVVASIISLVPVVPLTMPSTSSVTPSFFTSLDASAIPSGAVVLTYPYAYPVYNQQALLWQVNSDFRWRMLGAYASIPRIAKNHISHFVSVFPWPQPPESVPKFLEYWEGYNSGSRDSVTDTFVTVTPQLAEKTRTYLHRYHVDAVIVDLATSQSNEALKLFRAALGAPTIEGGVALWSHLTNHGL